MSDFCCIFARRKGKKPNNVTYCDLKQVNE